MLTVNLRICGLAMLVLAAIYPVYFWYFRWGDELKAVSPLTRQVFFVHCGFIMILLALQGVLLTFFPEAVTENSLGALALLVGMVVFWVYRFAAQLWIYKKELWQGHRLFTFVHAVFIILWTWFSAVCIWALWVHPAVTKGA